MSAWPTVALVDVLEGHQVSYGIVQPGNDFSAGVPIVRVKDVRNGLIDTRTPMKVHPSISQNHSRTVLRGGELLMTLVGTVGEVAVAPPSLAGWNVARAIAVIRSDSVSSAWLKLCIESPVAKAQVGALLNTTVQWTLNLSDLKTIQIAMPPHRDRVAIAEVLGALDDKIAANTKLAKAADALVRARFDGLRAEATMLIGELFELRREPADPARMEAHTAYVGLEHVPRKSMWLDDAGTSATVTSGKSYFEPGDVLFGKLRPYFHKVVTVAIGGICSTDILVLRSKKDSFSGFGLAAVSSEAVVNAVTAASEGTRMPRTSWNDLAAVEVTWPGEAVAREFSVAVRALEQTVQSLLRENRTLAATRDALLPQLMSGKLRVRDAEKSLAGVL